MAPRLKFAAGEKVLCFHGPLMYEAKCLKTTVNKDKKANFFIHYAGWNKNWDEWVPESRVFKYNSANLQKQKEVLKAHSSEFTKSKKTPAKTRKLETDSGSETPSTLPHNVSSASTAPTAASHESPAPTAPTVEPHDELPAPTAPTAKPHNKAPVPTAPTAKPNKKAPASTAPTAASHKKSPASTPAVRQAGKWPTPIALSSVCSYSQPSTSSEDSRKTRRRTNHSAESGKQCDNAKLKLRISIPDELKVWLVDDWDVVMRQHKLVNLPAKVTVDDVLENYSSQKRSSRTHTDAKDSILKELTNGIREYFNVALGCQLLYKFERPQYKEFIGNHPDTPMSQLYGTIHLMRLFVKMGPMLSYISMDEKALKQVLPLIHDFMQYVALNRASLLSLRDYRNATPEYHRSLI